MICSENVRYLVAKEIRWNMATKSTQAAPTDTEVPPTLIHVIDDDDAIRVSLSRLLQARGYDVCMYANAEQFAAAALPASPGCILLDLDMPGLDGLQLQEHLSKSHNLLPIIFLTGSGDFESSVRAIKAGAEDFLAKPVRSEQLFNAIDRALQRYHSEREGLRELDDLNSRYSSLTPREHEVFALVAQGLLNKQIAYQLGNTERTVKEQRRSVMEKMGADSLADLIVAAARLGIVDAR